ncbi:MAG TPA: glycoside hydrolase family 43 protein, partial [Chloroflexia bacterium]|nr:glycoside hydrolase family 43 protein [Chloroflexia bacterium]
DSTPGPATSATATVPAATATGVAVPSATAAAPALDPATSFQNPVLRTDFPDPFVLNVKGTYYAYATNASGKNIQTARSSDLVHWTLGGDAMPAVPVWAKPGGGHVWAPEVIAVGDQYVMYYTARDKASDKQCVGVASGPAPDGRFKDTRDRALVCQTDEGGTIDASPLRDGDKLYLYYKNDGNCCAIRTRLYVQELAPDGLSFTGAPTELVQNDAFWEGRVVEAPTMVKHGAQYYLFFSGNDYAGDAYAVGYAACQSATGPCADAPENPILKSRMTTKPLVIGPGHQAMIEVGDQTWLVYHAWQVVSGLRGDNRYMWMDRVTWEDGKPHVQGPTTDPQLLPGK